MNKRRTAQITLTSANMYDPTQADYDAWVEYVCRNIDNATGMTVGVYAAAMGDDEPGADQIEADTDDDREIISRALGDLWEDYCNGRNESCLARAIAYLDAIQIEDDQYAYWADETRSWWVSYDCDLVELCRYLDDPNSGGYSMWCADHTAREMPAGYDPRE